MYRTYNLTEAEKDKITVSRWDGDTQYYDVFESQEEYEKEEERLAKIDAEYQKEMKEYMESMEDR